MLLQATEGDEEFPSFDARRYVEHSGSGDLPVLNSAVVYEARVLRSRFGIEAESEADRRIALAMQNSRLDEAHHLWAVWLALKDER